MRALLVSLSENRGHPACSQCMVCVSYAHNVLPSSCLGIAGVKAKCSIANSHVGSHCPGHLQQAGTGAWTWALGLSPRSAAYAHVEYNGHQSCQAPSSSILSVQLSKSSRAVLKMMIHQCTHMHSPHAAWKHATDFSVLDPPPPFNPPTLVCLAGRSQKCATSASLTATGRRRGQGGSTLGPAKATS